MTCARPLAICSTCFSAALRGVNVALSFSLGERMCLSCQLLLTSSSCTVSLENYRQRLLCKLMHGCVSHSEGTAFLSRWVCESNVSLFCFAHTVRRRSHFSCRCWDLYLTTDWWDLTGLQQLVNGYRSCGAKYRLVMIVTPPKRSGEPVLQVKQT